MLIVVCCVVKPRSTFVPTNAKREAPSSDIFSSLSISNQYDLLREYTRE